jgi:hypothetical protein
MGMVANKVGQESTGCGIDAAGSRSNAAATGRATSGMGCAAGRSAAWAGRRGVSEVRKSSIWEEAIDTDSRCSRYA